MKYQNNQTLSAQHHSIKQNITLNSTKFNVGIYSLSGYTNQYQQVKDHHNIVSSEVLSSGEFRPMDNDNIYIIEVIFAVRCLFRTETNDSLQHTFISLGI